MSKKSYQKMSRAERRVAIAKDAMDQIHAGRISAMVGSFIFCNQDAKSPPKKCGACANGALFLAWFHLAGTNWKKQSDRAYSWDFKLCGLNDSFSPKQLSIIEAAFEGWMSPSSWYEEFPNEDDRMIAILQNIIDHDGTFKPDVMYEMA